MENIVCEKLISQKGWFGHGKLNVFVI